MTQDPKPGTGNPLSLVRVEDGWIYTAGQVGIAPGADAAPADFQAQMRIALENLERVIREAGGSMASVVKTTLFLVRREDFAAMNELHAAAFPEPYPARSTVVCELVLPELLFEIEAVARVEAA